MRASIIELGERGVAMAKRIGLTDARFFETPPMVGEFDPPLEKSVPHQDGAAGIGGDGGINPVR